jgi:DNA-directed RNA polymerase subunit RPC12/RpoP
MFFRNLYRCARCGHEWTDVWSAQCDDDCPDCGARHMAPFKSDDVDLTTPEKVALLNDAFRRTLSGGKAMMTAGVNELPDMVKAEVLCRVAAFNNFNEDNDPYGEHDCGNFEVCGRTFFWKIDYYDRDLQHGSEDPSDPEQTTRVLTVMLASEY